MIIISFNWPKKKTLRLFYYRVLTLLFCGIVYNIVSGLIPDSNFTFNILSQNIFAFSIGISAAAYFLFFLKNEYGIHLTIKLEHTLLIVSFSFVFFFVIPYTLFNDLNISRNLFLYIPAALLFYFIFIELKNIIYKLKEAKNVFIKIHIVIGLFALLSLLSLPLIIIIFGDNQLIEHVCFSFGFFIISIDYMFFYKKITENDIDYDLLLVEKLTGREREIFEILIENPNLKFVDISSKLFISEKTISTHMSNIYKKLEVKSRKKLLEKYEKRA